MAIEQRLFRPDDETERASGDVAYDEMRIEVIRRRSARLRKQARRKWLICLFTVLYGVVLAYVLLR